MGWDELRGTEFYNDFMQPAGISPRYPGIKLLEDGQCHASIGANPSVTRIDADMAKVERDLTCLARHVKQAVKLNRLTERLDPVAQSVEQVMEAIAAAAFLLDHEQRLIHANGKAEALLRDGKLFCKSPSGVLHAWRSNDNARLARMLAHPPSNGEPIQLEIVGIGSPLHRMAGSDGEPVQCGFRKVIGVVRTAGPAVVSDAAGDTGGDGTPNTRGFRALGI